jgi:hypothetical protein
MPGNSNLTIVLPPTINCTFMASTPLGGAALMLIKLPNAPLHLVASSVDDRPARTCTVVRSGTECPGPGTGRSGGLIQDGLDFPRYSAAIGVVIPHETSSASVGAFPGFLICFLLISERLILIPRSLIKCVVRFIMVWVSAVVFINDH